LSARPRPITISNHTGRSLVDHKTGYVSKTTPGDNLRRGTKSIRYFTIGEEPINHTVYFTIGEEQNESYGIFYNRRGTK